jgi:hypothetical protein
MPKPLLLVASIAAAGLLTPALDAQMPMANPAAVCPAGTNFSAIRHNLVKPGQWAAFQSAVAAHNAWYVSHGNKSVTKIARVLTLGATGPALSTTEAVTVTTYENAAQPPHDAAYSAFTAQYRASSDLKDEARICMP